MRSLRIFGRKKEKNASEREPVDGGEQIFSTAGNYGLMTLAQGNDDRVEHMPTDQVIMDNVADYVVFVHGLTGNRETTWTYNKTLFWPRDLLAKELPNARILTFGYDADIIGVLNMAGSNTIRDHGKSLAQDLAMLRVKTQSNDRPIIFVAHSLGGLVVEQSLLISRGTSQAHVKALLQNVNAIAFMGTPHLGSRKAEWARSLTHLSNMLRKTNKEILAVLEPGSEMLANLQQEFHTMLEDRRRNEGKWIDIFCFYEELPYPGIGDIVSRQSAILPEYPNASIHQDHSDMTKFSSGTDSGYVRIRDQLWLWLETIKGNEQKLVVASSQARTQAESTAHAQRAIEDVPLSADRNLSDDEESKQHRSQSGHNITSGGGAVFMGNIKTGRDFTYNGR